MRAVLACLLGIILAAPLRAQSNEPLPKRPKLDAGADTNDAHAYYEYGWRPKTDWKKAYDAFYWAMRLEPDVPDYTFARYLAFYYKQGIDWRVEYWSGSDFVTKSKESARLDTLYEEALLRNPYPYRSANGCSVPDWVLEEDDPYTQGLYFEDYGCGKQAADNFAKVLEKKPRDLALRERRARALYSVASYGDAIKELQVILDTLRARDKKRLDRYYQSRELYETMIGQAFARQDDYYNAKQAYGRALSENLAYYPAHQRLGHIALVQEDKETAIAEFRQAVELRPNDGVLRYDLGVAQIAAGQYADAETELRKAVELEPYFARAYYNLAVALQRQDKKADAAEMFRAFLARAPKRDQRLIKVAEAQLVALK